MVLDLPLRVLLVVAQVPHVDHLTPGLTHQRLEHRPVGVDDLPGAHVLPRCDELVTGGQDRHPDGPDHLDLLHAGRHHRRQLTGTDPGAARHDHVPRTQVLTRPADVGPLLGLHAELRLAGVAVGVLHPHHRVGPDRHGGAGHDPPRLAGHVLARERVARRDVTRHHQHDRGLGPRPGQVVPAHGIPVHRGVVEPRQVGPAVHVAAGHQPDGAGHRHGDGGDGSDLTQDLLEVLLDGDHRRPSGERARTDGTSVVGQVTMAR